MSSFRTACRSARRGALASYVAQRATAHRVFLQQTELRPTTLAGPGLTALTIEIRGDADLAGFLRFLQDVETGRPLVRVERIYVERTGGAPAGMPGDEEVLAFSATVRGFALSAAPTPDRPAGSE